MYPKKKQKQQNETLKWGENFRNKIFNLLHMKIKFFVSFYAFLVFNSWGGKLNE